jgi:hypothetical protein
MQSHDTLKANISRVKTYGLNPISRPVPIAAILPTKTPVEYMAIIFPDKL